MLDLAPHTETLLTVIVAAIPNIIMALAAYRKVGRNERKLDNIQKLTNGAHDKQQKKVDYLAHRLSKYEQLPPTYKESNERDSEPRSSSSGGSDASGSGSERGGDEKPL